MIIDFFLTYTCVTKCPSYTVAGTINDEYFEIDASNRFIHLPIKAGLNENYVNHISLQVKSTIHNDSFKAIPTFFWYIPDPKKKTRKKIFTNQSYNNWLLQDHSVQWLGPKSLCNFQVDSKLVQSPSRGGELIINNSQKLDALPLTMLDFDYVPNSWFVCYNTRKKDLTGTKAWSPLTDPYYSVRIHKNFSVGPIHTQDRFNYVTIGDKTIPLNSVTFFKKINTIWDWMNCVKMAHIFYNLNHY